MQVRSFLLTLGLGMAAGGTVALMLPRQSGVRREAQKAADAVEQTITDVETLLAQLEAVRRGELAMEREESTDQLACWAAPLRRKGTVFAALSISVPLFRCREEKIELVRRSLLTAQAEIEKLAETRNFGLSEN